MSHPEQPSAGSRDAFRGGAFAGIASVPEVWGGAAVIAGTRIPVFMLAEMHRYGRSVADLQADYPQLTRAQIRRALVFARVFPMVVSEDRDDYDAACRAAAGTPPDTERQ